MRAFIFPGQGSQKVGMGVDLAAASPAAREVFQEVDDALNQKLFAIMSAGPDDALTLTENAQPAIMANAIAVLRVLEKEGGISLADKAAFVVGLIRGLGGNLSPASRAAFAALGLGAGGAFTAGVVALVTDEAGAAAFGADFGFG